MAKHRFSMCNKITIVKYFFGGNARNPTSSPARAGGPAWRFEQLLDNRHRLSIVVILHELLGILEDIVNEKDTPRNERKIKGGESWLALWARASKIVWPTEEFQTILFWGVMTLVTYVVSTEWNKHVLSGVGVVVTNSPVVLALPLYAAGGGLMALLRHWMKTFLVELCCMTVGDFVKGFNNPNAPFSNTFMLKASTEVLAIHILNGRFDPICWCCFIVNQGLDFVYWYYRNTIFAAGTFTLLGWLLGKEWVGWP